MINDDIMITPQAAKEVIVGWDVDVTRFLFSTVLHWPYEFHMYPSYDAAFYALVSRTPR